MSKQAFYDDFLAWVREQPDEVYAPALPDSCAIGQFGQAKLGLVPSTTTVSRQVMNHYGIDPEVSVLACPQGWWGTLCVADDAHPEINDNTFKKLADRLEANREYLRG